MTGPTRLLALAALRDPDPRTDARLASAAAGAPTTLDDLVRVVTAPHGGGGLEDGDSGALAWCGWLVAARASSPAELTAGAALLDLAGELGGESAWGRDHAQLRAQVAAELGDLRPAALAHPRVPDETVWQLVTDAANPHPDGGRPPAAWLESFNQPFTVHGLAPVTVHPGSGSPIRRLGAPDVLPGTVGGPLVTVVMPLFRPDADDLEMAVRSVAAQSWADLEILLVDDASGADGADVIARCATLDPRARVVTATTNGGAYAARNLGVAAASGDLVTFADGDDWAHPQRLERQMNVMLREAEVACSLGWSVRADAGLRLVRRGRMSLRPNMSTSLFRRRRLVDELGAFDQVRKSGDAELLGRARAAFGPSGVVELDAPLGVVQLTEGSLSRDDFGFGWIHPDRADYKRSWLHWHHRIASGESSPFVRRGTRAPVPCPAPLLDLPLRPARADVGLLADLDPVNRTAVDIGAEVAALTAFRPGLVVADGAGPVDLRPRRLGICPELEDLAAAGRAHKLGHHQVAEVDTMVVRDPALVAHVRTGAVQVRAREILVVVDAVSLTPDVDLDEVVALLEDTGASVRWLPADDIVADELRTRLGPGTSSRILPARPWGTTRPAPTPRAHRDLPDRPRIAFAPFLDGLGGPRARRWAGRRIPARTSVTTSRARRLLGSDLPTLEEGWALDPDVLGSLDVVVLPAFDTLTRGLDVTVLRCLAAGTLVVTDPVTAARFDGAVLPLGPAEELDPALSDGAAVSTVRDVAHALLERRLGRAAFMATMDEVLSPPAR